MKKYDVRYESMYMDLKPVTYELISTPGKTHCGLIALCLKEAMDKNESVKMNLLYMSMQHKDA